MAPTPPRSTIKPGMILYIPPRTSLPRSSSLSRRYCNVRISTRPCAAICSTCQEYDQGIEPEKAKKLIKISITPNDSIGDIRVTTLDRKGLPTFLGPSISRRGFRPNVTTTISKAIHDLLANTTRGTHRHIQIRISPNESVHRVKVFAERPAHNSTAFPQNTGDRVLQLTGTDKPTRSGGRLLSQEVSNATVLVENGTGNGTVTNGESRDVTKMPRLFGASVELEVDV